MLIVSDDAAVAGDAVVAGDATAAEDWDAMVAGPEAEGMSDAAAGADSMVDTGAVMIPVPVMGVIAAEVEVVSAEEAAADGISAGAEEAADGISAGAEEAAGISEAAETGAWI